MRATFYSCRRNSHGELLRLSQVQYKPSKLTLTDRQTGKRCPSGNTVTEKLLKSMELTEQHPYTMKDFDLKEL